MKPSSRTTRIAKRLIYRSIHAHRALHSVTAHCCGLRFRIASNCRIGEAIYSNGFERMQRGILDQVIVPGSTVIDVGANLGFYTCLFAKKVGPFGQVIAVEPTPTVFQALQYNIYLNRMSDRVASLRVALSHEQGTAKMNVFSEGNEVYNSLGVTKSWLPEPPESSIEVETTTLGSLLRELPRETSCFIKIDVEGFQHQVLQGGVQHLREMPNLGLMVELNDAASEQCGTSSEESLKLLGECGFSPYLTMDGRSLVPLSEDAYLSHSMNDDVFFFKNPTCMTKAA